MTQAEARGWIFLIALPVLGFFWLVGSLQPDTDQPRPREYSSGARPNQNLP